MSLKLAVLLLFGFVALAVAVPLEDTEEKAKPAEPVTSDAEKPEATLEESEAAESEDDNQEDAEKEPEADDNEDEPENEVEAKDEDGTDKRSGYLRRCTYTRTYRCGIRKSHCRFTRGRRHINYCCRLSRFCGYRHDWICRHCRRCKRGFNPRLVCHLGKRCCGVKCLYNVLKCKCYCRRKRG